MVPLSVGTDLQCHDIVPRYTTKPVAYPQARQLTESALMMAGFYLFRTAAGQS